MKPKRTADSHAQAIVNFILSIKNQSVPELVLSKLSEQLRARTVDRIQRQDQ